MPGGKAPINTTAGGCPYSTVAAISGYNGTTPSTIDNSPGGALEQAMGLHTNQQGAGVLYAFDAHLNTQSEAVFGGLRLAAEQAGRTPPLGARYSGDQKQGYEQEINVFWIPLVANQARPRRSASP